MEKHEEIECYKCGVAIVASPTRIQNLRDSGDMFWCINGHSQHFTKSTVQKLREQLAEKERKISMLERENIDLKKKPKRTYKKKAK